MIERLAKWLEERTGLGSLIRSAFLRQIPGPPGWGKVWGTVLVVALLTEFITGLAMWTVYSPGALSSWESVHHLQHAVAGGWFLRGLHHWVAQIMVVLLLLHLVQMVLFGLYRAPREVNFWLYIGLMLVVMATSFTGYVLPWDRRGYMAAQISTGLMTNTPVIGQSLRQIALGGSSAGHATLTRFATLHTGVFPAVIAGLILLLARLNRRHEAVAVVGPTGEKSPLIPWWPRQAWRDGVAVFVVLAAILSVVMVGHGAELGGPANPGEQDLAARPDWYFLFLFRMLHWPVFAGTRQIVPALIVPGVVIALLFLLPFVGKNFRRHRPVAALVLAGIAVYFGMTGCAFLIDRRDETHMAAVRQAEVEAARAHTLVERAGGVPPGGALTLMENDPVTQGARLFAKKCSTCHAFMGHDGQGLPLGTPASAADLAGFGSRQWLREFMDPAHIATSKYWGDTAFVKPAEGRKQSKMVKYVIDDVADFSAEKKQQLEKVVVALSAEARLRSQAADDARDAALIADGAKLVGGDGLSCTDCHAWRDEKDGKPDLNGWASRDWTIEFIKNPAHERFYGGRNDRMPAYAEKDELTPRQIEMIVDWMRGEAE